MPLKGEDPKAFVILVSWVERSLDNGTTSHSNKLKLEDINANKVIRNQGRAWNATLAKGLGMI